MQSRSTISTIFFATIINLLCAQTIHNLSFEQVGQDQKPLGWETYVWVNDRHYYTFSIDSTTVHNGNYALRIASDKTMNEENNAMCKYKIPINFQGQKITFKCFIKTESIKGEGYANLWIRVHNQYLMSIYRDSKKEKVAGSTDWTECSVEIPFNKEDVFFNLGLNFEGAGKAWFDDIRLYVDDKPFELTKLKKKLKKAPIDSSFLESSKVKITSLSKNQITNLDLLGKIWGFLKYQHPTIAQGKYNWDIELFKIIPSLLNCKNTKNRDELLLNWIDNFGKIDSCLQCPELIAQNFKLKPNFKWINSIDMNQNLIDKLNYIHKNRSQNNHYYIAKSGIGNPIFTNEEAYYNMILPDVGYRLLALFRFWNIIEYYSPYKYDMKCGDWNKMMIKFIPRMIESNDTVKYRKTLVELVGTIEDTHASVNFADLIWQQNVEGQYNIPVQVIFVNNEAVIAGFLKSDIESYGQFALGDIILEIDGKNVKDIIKERLKITPGSNESVQLFYISQKLLRGTKPDVSIKIKRNDNILTLKVKRFAKLGVTKKTWQAISDSCYRQISKDIGYMHLSKIEFNQLPMMYEKFKNTKGIIVDIRNYPSQFVVFALSHYLLPHKVPFVKFTFMDVNYPGLFKWDRLEYVGSENSEYYKGKVIILVNENTLSQAEYTTMALRTAPNAIVVGSQTAGADGDVSPFVLPGNFYSTISGIGIYYPDGKETQRIGIVPDVIVKPTIEGVKAGKDELLEKAIEIINQ